MRLSHKAIKKATFSALWPLYTLLSFPVYKQAIHWFKMVIVYSIQTYIFKDVCLFYSNIHLFTKFMTIHEKIVLRY